MGTAPILLFSRLSDAWLDLLDRDRKDLSALVVDDEPAVVDVVSALLETEGFGVDASSDAESGWQRILAHRYDLLVVDKSLPGESGIELLRRVHGAGLDVPAVVITSYASTESIDQALELGASAFITKPFTDLRRLLGRLRDLSELERPHRLAGRAALVLSDLAEADSPDGELTRNVIGRLWAARSEFDERRRMLVAAEQASAGSIAGALSLVGLESVTASSGDQATASLTGTDGPLGAIVDLSMPDASRWIRTATGADPLLGVVAVGHQRSLREAIEALENGAEDFVLHSIHGLHPLARRAARLAARLRRRRLHVTMLALFERHAAERGHELAARLTMSLTERQRQMLRAVPTPEGLLRDRWTDVEGLFGEPELPEVENRRRLPRHPVAIPVEFREAGTNRDLRSAHTRDISLGGLFLLSGPPPEAGRQLELRLHPADTTPVSALGEVVRTVEGGPEPGAGVRVLEPTISAYRALVARVTGAHPASGSSAES